MERKPFFTGVCTALVTPFDRGKVNYTCLENLLERQIRAGVPAVVIAGTTGEGATLSDAEKLQMTAFAKKFAGNRMLIITGTGSNDTAHAVRLSLSAEKAGADGLLVVSPYYNKATPAGLLAHYRAISDAVSIPIIAYNVPSRTGVNIPVDVYQHLAALPNIVGVKEACPDLSRVSRTLRSCGKDFTVWSGNDDLTVPILSLGGQGVISVLSNLFPEIMQKMTRLALSGDFPAAAAIQLRLQPLVDTLFSEVNPIPVKAAMRLLGIDCGPCRLPLTEMDPENLQALKTALAQI